MAVATRENLLQMKRPAPSSISNILGRFRKDTTNYRNGHRIQVAVIETIAGKLARSVDPHTRMLAEQLADCVATMRELQSGLAIALGQFNDSLDDPGRPET
jgi:hypothetical protein